MKKYICIIICFIFVLCLSAHAGSTAEQTPGLTDTDTETVTTEEITEDPPTEAADGEDIAHTFMNINIYMFAGGVVLVIICTVVHFILKAKRNKTAS